MNARHAPAVARRRERGLTLVECLTALSISALAVGATLPGAAALVATKRLEGAAAQLETDFQLARSMAVAQHRTLRLSFKSDAHGSCYVVHGGGADACDCDIDGSARCAAGAAAWRSVRLAAGTTLRSNARSIVIDGAKGTITPTATLRLSEPGGRSMHVVANLMGRVRSCTPAPALPGHPRC